MGLQRSSLLLLPLLLLRFGLQYYVFSLFLIQATQLDETNSLSSVFASPKNITRTQNFFYQHVTWTKMMFFLQPLLIVGIMLTYKRLNTDLFILTVM